MSPYREPPRIDGANDWAREALAVLFYFFFALGMGCLLLLIYVRWIAPLPERVIEVHHVVTIEEVCR